MLIQPVFNNNKAPECVEDKNVLVFFEKIVNGIGTKKPIASSYKKYIHVAKRSYNRGWRHFEKYYLNKIKPAKG
jgi:hypothetical protein